MSELAAMLSIRLASSASGYAVVRDGLLDLRTVAPHQNAAAALAIVLAGVRLLSTCHDPGCDCRVSLMKRMLPEAKIVAVNVEVTNDAV